MPKRPLFMPALVALLTALVAAVPASAVAAPAASSAGPGAPAMDPAAAESKKLQEIFDGYFEELVARNHFALHCDEHVVVDDVALCDDVR